MYIFFMKVLFNVLWIFVIWFIMGNVVIEWVFWKYDLCVFKIEIVWIVLIVKVILMKLIVIYIKKRWVFWSVLLLD